MSDFSSLHRPFPVLYGPRVRKIRYTAATTAGVVMRSTTRRNNVHSHHDRSTVLPLQPSNILRRWRCRSWSRRPLFPPGIPGYGSAGGSTPLADGHGKHGPVPKDDDISLLPQALFA